MTRRSARERSTSPAFGDYVLVHAGFAISVVDAEEAAQILDYVRQIGELDELGGEEERGAPPRGGGGTSE